MKRLILAALFALMPCLASAQSTPDLIPGILSAYPNRNMQGDTKWSPTVDQWDAITKYKMDLPTGCSGYLYIAGGVTTACNVTVPSSAVSGFFPASQIADRVRAYNVSGSNLATIGTLAIHSNALTVANVLDFSVGQGVRVNHAGTAFALNAPSGGTVTPTGTTGSTAYQYEVAALDANGGVGAVASSFQTAVGNATLSATNYNALTWTASTGTTPAGYAVYKNISGTYNLVGVTPTNSFNDYGFLSYTALDWIPATAPVAKLADWLVTTISTINGTSFGLAAAASTGAVTQGVYHDDTSALSAYFAANYNAPLPIGRYLVSSQISIPAYVQINGAAQWQSVITGVQIFSYIFKLNYGDNISNLTFQVPPLSAAMGAFNINSVNLTNITCQGANLGGASAYCLYDNNGDQINGTNLTLQGWPGIASGQATGGGVPGINVQSGVGVNLSNVQSFNSSNTPLPTQSTVWFNSCFNCTILNSSLNNNQLTNANNTYGVYVTGGSQADIITSNQILNYTADVRVDAQTTGGLLTVDIEANHFDFCGLACVLFGQGQWFTVVGNSFAGEHFAGIDGILFGSSAIYGPNSIIGNTMDGFDGSGSYNMAFNSSLVATTVADNVFTHTGTPAISTAGAQIVIHDNSGYNPVGVYQAAYAVASGATYTAGASPETHYLTGGTISAVKIPAGTGSTVCTATPCPSIVLGPGETMSVTYSAVPQDIKSVH